MTPSPPRQPRTPLSPQSITLGPDKYWWCVCRRNCQAAHRIGWTQLALRTCGSRWACMHACKARGGKSVEHCHLSMPQLASRTCRTRWACKREGGVWGSLTCHLNQCTETGGPGWSMHIICEGGGGMGTLLKAYHVQNLLHQHHFPAASVVRFQNTLATHTHRKANVLTCSTHSPRHLVFL